MSAYQHRRRASRQAGSDGSEGVEWTWLPGNRQIHGDLSPSLPNTPATWQQNALPITAAKLQPAPARGIARPNLCLSQSGRLGQPRGRWPNVIFVERKWLFLIITGSDSIICRFRLENHARASNKTHQEAKWNYLSHLPDFYFLKDTFRQPLSFSQNLRSKLNIEYHVFHQCCNVSYTAQNTVSRIKFKDKNPDKCIKD